MPMLDATMMVLHSYIVMVYAPLACPFTFTSRFAFVFRVPLTVVVTLVSFAFVFLKFCLRGYNAQALCLINDLHPSDIDKQLLLTNLRVASNFLFLFNDAYKTC